LLVVLLLVGWTPTIQLNRLRVTAPKRRGSDTRGMVLARWGGLGNHRYQVGFSGDVDLVRRSEGQEERSNGRIS